MIEPCISSLQWDLAVIAAILATVSMAVLAGVANFCRGAYHWWRFTKAVGGHEAAHALVERLVSNSSDQRLKAGLKSAERRGILPERK